MNSDAKATKSSSSFVQCEAFFTIDLSKRFPRKSLQERIGYTCIRMWASQDDVWLKCLYNSHAFGVVMLLKLQTKGLLRKTFVLVNEVAGCLLMCPG